jgi:hypothetical protein
LVLILLTAGNRAAYGQTCKQETSLVNAVRAATARYRDPEVAQQNGYRSISHDFPAMGEHWINLSIATADTFDVRHPSILLYARKQDQLELVGAAFTALLDPGEALPGPAFLSRKWHGHAGTLDDELFAASHGEHIRADQFNVLVLHVWTWLPNDADPFAVENWRLPAMRAGMRTHALDNDAARALSLLTSSDYYRIALVKIGVPLADDAKLNELIQRYRAQVALQKNLSRLGAVWRRFAAEISEHWPQTQSALSRLTRDAPDHHACEQSNGR